MNTKLTKPSKVANCESVDCLCARGSVPARSSFDGAQDDPEPVEGSPAGLRPAFFQRLAQAAGASWKERLFRLKSCVSVVIFVLVAPAAFVLSAQGSGVSGGTQMPDVKRMSGIPLPSGDVAMGTVAVRVIRGSLSNPIPGQSVELEGAPTPISGTTNDAGRVEFTGLKPGLRVKAVTTVSGERLESEEFTVPAAGGIRLLLSATDPAAKRAADDQKMPQTPAQPGSVVLGDQSRFVFEMGEDSLSLFSILQIVNPGRTPVQPAQALVFDLPADAERPAILEGSSRQASLAGKRITVNGPFATGDTLVQFAYSMPYSGGSLTVQQILPAALTRFTVVAQKVGDMHLGSPQMSQQREMTAEGHTYIVGQGPALEPGAVVTFEFTGLPHEPRWPRNVALTLVAVILGGGVWSAARARKVTAAEEARRQKLEAKRDWLFSELTALEEQHRAGAVDSQRFASQRRDLVIALERVYAELDIEPPGAAA